MGLFDRAAPADLLAELLERERSAALEGRIDELDRLGAEKPRLAEMLRNDPPVRADLARLRRMAAHNTRLLEAVRNGVAAAQQRVRALRAGAPLTTYDADGNSAPVSAHRITPGHRA